MEEGASRRLKKPRSDPNDQRNSVMGPASGRSSHDGGRNRARNEPDAGQSGHGDVPMTDSIPGEEENVIIHNGMDIDVIPPASRPITGSSPKHQAHPAPPTTTQVRLDKFSEGRSTWGHTGAHNEMRMAEEKGNQEAQLRQEESAREKEEQRRFAIEKKKTELARLKVQVSEAENSYHKLAETNQRLSEEANHLNTQWNNDFRVLESQRHALNASRSFASCEGTLDAATLIQSFGDLNSSIGDFSFEVLRGLDEKVDTDSLKVQTYRNLHNKLSDENLKYFVKSIMDRDLKAGDVVDPIVMGIIVSELMSTIFQPFAPGLDPDRSRLLRRMCEHIRGSEPQERSARWRSITYTHAVPNRNPEFLKKAAQSAINKVSEALTILKGGGDPVPLTEEYYHLAISIFESAVKLQTRAKVDYVSYDYEVYTLPAKERYDQKLMELSQEGKGTPSHTWITVGLGMRAQRAIRGGGNSITVEKSIPVKPMVICDNWDPNA